jgi:YggT family protein
MNVTGLIASLLNLYATLILIYVVLSWFVMTGAGAHGAVADLYRVLATFCEPYLGLFRRVIPPIMVGGGGLDLSPLLALLVLQFVARLIGGLG